MCAFEKNKKNNIERTGQTGKTKLGRLRISHLYLLALICGIASGFSKLQILHEVGAIIADIFTNIFKTLSLPIISLSVIVTLSKFSSNIQNRAIWYRTSGYTLLTTIIAATVSMLIYLVVDPSGVQFSDNSSHSAGEVHRSAVHEVTGAERNVSYLSHILKIVPTNLLGSFTEQNVLSVLLISISIGLAIAKISEQEAHDSLHRFFNSLYKVFLLITEWVMAVLPLALFGFIIVAITKLQESSEIFDIVEYLLIVISANIIQGVVILPLMLLMKGVSPRYVFTKMLPALSIAFFSKSSTGTLPVTMRCAEELKIKPEISQFVLPMCTTINMNGCAAFIFTTVIFVMQSHGVPITLETMILWIAIATVAAIGNAGVPMGCFFLSISLLSSMDIPLELMGVILPFYNIIDMIETALNVWSDSVVTVAVDQDMKKFQ